MNDDVSDLKKDNQRKLGKQTSSSMKLVWHLFCFKPWILYSKYLLIYIKITLLDHLIFFV